MHERTAPRPAPIRSSTPGAVSRRRGSARAVIVLGCLLVVGLLVLLLVLQAGSPAPSDAFRPPTGEARDAVAPAPMGDVDEAIDGDPASAQELEIEARRGGWIQVAAPDDPARLAQRYRFERLDPVAEDEPAGHLSMREPRAEIFLDDGRILSLRGERALARVPHRALEGGRMTGDVEIRLHEGPPGAIDATLASSPILTVRTDAATFDSVSGEIRCVGPVDVAADRATMTGSGLVVRLNDRDRVLTMRLATLDEAWLLPGQDEAASAEQTPPAADAPSGSAGRRGGRVRKPKDDAQPPTPYRLRFDERVRLVQHLPGGRRTLAGSSMDLLFTTASEGIRGAIAAGPGTADEPLIGCRALVEPVGRSWRAGLLADEGSGAVVRPVRTDDGRVQVLCDGPVTMIPMPATSEGAASAEADALGHLDDPKDAMVVLVGEPATLVDDGDGTTAEAGRIEYRLRGGRLDLRGHEGRWISMVRDGLAIDAPHLWLDRSRSTGGVTGPGRAVERPAGADARAASAADEPDDGAPAEAGSTDLVTDLEITWTEGVDLRFGDDDANQGMGTIERIVFRGKVAADSPDGLIRCDTLELNVTPDDDGALRPQRLVAVGSIRTQDGERTMWADSLTVTFEERAAADAPAEGGTASAEDRDPAIAGAIGRDAQVRTALAAGDVQVRLEDGSRAFADQMFSDSRRDELELSGEEVVILSGRLLMDRGRRLVIRRGERTINVPGPGRLRVFTEPLPARPDGRIERPRIEADAPDPELRVRWNESMLYEGDRNDGAGSIDLRGTVVAESRPGPREVTTLAGDSVLLDLAMDPVAAAGRETDRDREDLVVQADDRRLARLTARGQARLESRQWLDDAHTGRPRVTYVDGRHLVYDDLTGAARVIGDGELIIRDEWTGGDDPGGRPGPAASFGGKGTTAFTWQRALDLTPTGGDLVEITMTGSVGGRHLGLDGATATISGEKLVAVARRNLDRRDQRRESAAGTGDRRPVGLELGGDLTLRRLRGEGAMRIATRDRLVDCDLLVYDVQRNVAELSARPGRTVSVLREGEPFPLKAEAVVWNMDPRIDTITVRRGSGGAGG